MLDLLKERFSCVLAKIELLTEVVDHYAWVIAFEHTDFFHILAVKLDLQNANWLWLETVHCHGRRDTLDLLKPGRMAPVFALPLSVAIL